MLVLSCVRADTIDTLGNKVIGGAVQAGRQTWSSAMASPGGGATGQPHTHLHSYEASCRVFTQSADQGGPQDSLCIWPDGSGMSPDMFFLHCPPVDLYTSDPLP